MKIFRCKNLLVTGGAGFIGSNFIRYILDKYKNVKIYNLDLLTYAGDLKNTVDFQNNSNYKFIKGDICSKETLNEVFKEFEIDGVINFAAETHVDNSIKNPDVFIKTNIYGVYCLLSTCFNHWMKDNFRFKNNYTHSRFHQISTDEIYGSIKDGSFSENNNYNPNSPYSSSKASADMIIRSFHKTYGLNVTTSICSNNYGPNQNLEKFIPKSLKSIKNNKPVIIYGNGSNIRDWIHVDDHCNAIDLIFNNSKSGEKYNVASNYEISNLNLIKYIYSTLKLDENIRYIEDRHGHDFRYSISTDKIKSKFKWNVKNNIKDYLSKKLLK